jgi:hypothetical protein
VINDANLRIMLTAKLIWGLESSIINVETEFLHGESTEEINMNIPEGMNEDQGYCLQSKKTIKMSKKSNSCIFSYVLLGSMWSSQLW